MKILGEESKDKKESVERYRKYQKMTKEQKEKSYPKDKSDLNRTMGEVFKKRKV